MTVGGSGNWRDAKEKLTLVYKQKEHDIVRKKEEKQEG